MGEGLARAATGSRGVVNGGRTVDGGRIVYVHASFVFSSAPSCPLLLRLPGHSPSRRLRYRDAPRTPSRNRYVVVHGDALLSRGALV